MRRGLAIAIVALAACASTGSLAQYSRGAPGAGQTDTESHLPPPTDTVREPPDPEAHAEDLRIHGRCDQAIPIFRRLASRGGFEIAQFNLGLCLLDVAGAEHDPQQAAILKTEAAKSILTAANSGLANAQIKLVSLYLDGVGVALDPLEAGKWALIYHSNGARFVISLPDISPELQERLDKVLTASNWAKAQSLADAWTPTPKNWDGVR